MRKVSVPQILFCIAAFVLSGPVATQLNPDKPPPERDVVAAEKLREEGESLLRNGHFEEAIVTLTRAIALTPYDREALRLRGFAYYGNADFDRAVADFTEVIERAPGTGAYMNRATIYKRVGKLDLAIDDLTHALRWRRSCADSLLAARRSLRIAGRSRPALSGLHGSPPS